jgi:pilus assembly protein Flp/PilA
VKTLEQDEHGMQNFITSSRCRRFMLDESGATAIEYAMIAGGVSIVILAVVTQIGSTMNELYYNKLLKAF